jgi:hypothetical protein
MECYKKTNKKIACLNEDKWELLMFCFTHTKAKLLVGFELLENEPDASCE